MHNNRDKSCDEDLGKISHFREIFLLFCKNLLSKKGKVLCLVCFAQTEIQYISNVVSALEKSSASTFLCMCIVNYTCTKLLTVSREQEIVFDVHCTYFI